MSNHWQVRLAQMDSKVDQWQLRAKYLVVKFEQEGGTSHIDEAIVLDHEALELCPPGHPERFVSFARLGIHLSDRYGGMSDSDLEEAILNSRDALALHPPGHPDRLMALSNLSIPLSTRCKRLGAMKEVIVLNRDALALRPPGHPGRSMSLNDFAACLSTLYNQLGAMEDLDTANALDRGPLALHPRGTQIIQCL